MSWSLYFTDVRMTATPPQGVGLGQSLTFLTGLSKRFYEPFLTAFNSRIFTMFIKSHRASVPSSPSKSKLCGFLLLLRSPQPVDPLSGTQGDLPDQGDVHPHLGAIHTFSVKVSKLDTFIIKCTTGGMDMQTILKDFLFKNTKQTNLGLNYQIRHTLFSCFIVKLFELTFFCPFLLRIICLISSLFSLSIFYLKNFNNFDTRLLTYRQFMLDFYHQLTKT